jgi:hypothetical protein
LRASYISNLVLPAELDGKAAIPPLGAPDRERI